MMKRTLWAGVLSTFALAALAFTAISADAQSPNFGSPPSGAIPILYNDMHVYAKPDVLKQDRVLAAQVQNGQLMIPLRSMFEQMGATVSYDASTQTVTASKAGASVSVTLGKPEVVINGESRPLDVPPIMWHGVLLVPVRVISEGMGAYVQWVQDRHIVVVRYIAPTAPPPPPPPPPTAMPPPPPPPPPPPVHSWAGLYVGLNAGGITNRDTGVAYCVTPATAVPPRVINGAGCSYPAYGMMNAGGFLGGAQLGWNWQAGGLVIGPEFDYDGSTLQQSTIWSGEVKEYGFAGTIPGQFTASENMSSFSSERIRIGFASPRTLIYVTGGWAQSIWTLTSNQSYALCVPCQYPTSVTISRQGWTEGLGGEFAMGPRVSIKVEGLDYEFPEYSTLSAANAATGFYGGKDFYFHGIVARVGVNWRF